MAGILDCTFGRRAGGIGVHDALLVDIPLEYAGADVQLTVVVVQQRKEAAIAVADDAEVVARLHAHQEWQGF